VNRLKIASRLSAKIKRYFNQRKIQRYFDNFPIRKLQLGSGENPLDGWLNTDLEPRDDMVYLDIRLPFVFADDSFDYIYSEHLIEHVSYRHGLKCLNECFRVLRPGGRIRIATPNLSFLLDLYDGCKTDIQQRYISWSANTFFPDVGRAEDTFVINNFFRNWNHEFIYDLKTLRESLTKVGFTSIQSFPVGNSDDSVLRGLEGHGRMIPPEFNEIETMVVEAKKF